MAIFLFENLHCVVYKLCTPSLLKDDDSLLLWKEIFGQFYIAAWRNKIAIDVIKSKLSFLKIIKNQLQLQLQLRNYVSVKLRN